MKRKHLMPLALILLWLVAGLGLWVWTMRNTSHQGPSIASATFDDGFELRVHEVLLTAKAEFTKESPWWAKYVSLSNESGNSVDCVVIKHKTENGSFKAAALEYQNITTPSLMLVLSARQPDGQIFNNGQWWIGDTVRDSRRDTDGILRLDMPELRSVTFEDMPLGLQVENGAGGWLNMDGPFVVSDRDDRALAASRIFPRRSEKLRIRALRQGLPPVELTVTNPGYKPSFPTPIVGKLPYRRTTAEYECQHLGFTQTDQGWEDDFKFQIINLPIQGEQPLNLRLEVFDSTGNRINRRWSKLSPLPGTQALHYVASVERQQDTYPYFEKDVVFVAEVTVPQSGGAPVAHVTAAGAALGVKTVEFAKPATPSRATKSSLTLTGESVPAALHSFEDTLVLFGEGPRRLGTSGMRQTSQQNGSPRALWKNQSEWEAPLKPGDKVRVGMIKRAPPEVFDFWVPLPASPSATAPSPLPTP
jgi:hypothetical protein